MPDPLGSAFRSSLSQIASYAPPPEPLVSSAAETGPAAPVVPAHLDISSASSPVERAKPRLSYEACIATHERAAQKQYGEWGAIGGCVTVGLAGANAGLGILKTPPGIALGAALGCVGGALSGFVAAGTQGTVIGSTEGKIACDDVPRKP